MPQRTGFLWTEGLFLGEHAAMQRKRRQRGQALHVEIEIDATVTDYITATRNKSARWIAAG